MTHKDKLKAIIDEYKLEPDIDYGDSLANIYPYLIKELEQLHEEMEQEE